jgi:hypothetical protein
LSLPFRSSSSSSSSFLGSTAQLGLGLLLKIRLNFLEATQQFSFLQGRVVSPTPNPHPGGPGLCIYIPQRQGGPVVPLVTHFSRLLRHAWVTVGLFLFPCHHTGIPSGLPIKIMNAFLISAMLITKYNKFNCGQFW